MVKSLKYKDIPGYEGLYGINKIGEILSYSRNRLGMNNSFSYRNERLLKQTGKNQNDYLGVSLYDRDKKKHRILVHKLVYLTFKGEIPQGKQINHIDGNKFNNNFSNLEVCTPKENISHAWKTGLAKKDRSKMFSKLNLKDVKIIRNVAKKGISHREIADIYKVSRSHISRIIKGEHWPEDIT